MAPDPAITDGPVPKHRQVRDLIVGLAEPGRAIPSERELVARYGVSRATVRKAIDGLVADGVLTKSLGRGTFATRPRVESHLHLASFSADMRRRGMAASSRILSIALHRPPADVAAALHLGADALAWRLHRIRLADDAPLAVEVAWYPAAPLPGLDRHDLVHESLYDILGRTYGHWIDRAEQTLWGESADDALAKHLQAAPGTPLLVFRRTSTSAGVPIEHVTSHYRGDRYQLHMTLTAP